MIPSRGIRWSGQIIGIGRRRTGALSARQFSSVHIGPVRRNPFLSKNGASIANTYTRLQFSQTVHTLRNGAGIRFASTAPVQSSAPEAATISPTDAVTSSSTGASDLTSSSLDDALDFSSESLYDMPEKIGYLKALGLDYGWGPTALMEWTLEHIHVLAGTPWWVSIALTAVAVRVLLFKPYLGAAETASKLAAIKHITGPIQEKMKAASQAKDTEAVMRIRSELSRIHQRAGIKIWKSFVPLLQAFLGYGTFVLLRGMAKVPVPGWETGGALWFYNLSIPDPYLIFPVATAAVMHWLLRRGGETGVTTISAAMSKAIQLGLPFLSLMFTWWMPVGLQLSFFVTTCLSYIQASLFRMPAFRRYFNMTPLPPSIPGGMQKATSPYRGYMHIRTPLPSLSQEANQTSQSGVPNAKASNQTKAKATGVLDGAIKDVMGTYKSARSSFTDMTEKGKKSLQARMDKDEMENARKYEAKRQKEFEARAVGARKQNQSREGREEIEWKAVKREC